MEDPIPQNTDMVNNEARVVNAFTVGAIATVVFIVVVTIVGELWSPLKTLLKEAHHHHWVGKGVWSVITFVVVGIGYFLIVRNSSETTTNKLLKRLALTLVLGTLILLAFFSYKFFIHI